MDADTTPKPPPSHPDVAAPASGRSRLPVAGDTIAGKYLLRSVIGEGGMGVVYEGVHLTLGQPVAIKLLLPDVAHRTDAIGRFLREARAAAQIRCEHAVRIFDVDKTETGAPYLVMERLVGSTLDSLLARQEKVSVGDTVDYVLQACEAIAEAHAAGIVHRDLKPQNLFVTRTSDGDALVKVLDFGISKTLDAPPESSVLTGPDVALGSPEYMSPEQVRHAAQVDERTDIWSLGVILYELLSGRLPFEGDSVPHLFVLIMTEAPRPLREVAPEIPDGLASLVDGCLAKDPAARPASVANLAAALAPFGRDDAVVLADRVRRAAGMTPAIRIEPPPSGRVEGRRVHSGTLAETTMAQPAWTIPPARSRSRAWWLASRLAAVAAVVVLAGIVGAKRGADRATDAAASSAPIGTTRAAHEAVTPASAPMTPTPLPAPGAPAAASVASASVATDASVASAPSAKAAEALSLHTPPPPHAVPAPHPIASARPRSAQASAATPAKLENIDEMKPLP